MSATAANPLQASSTSFKMHSEAHTQRFPHLELSILTNLVGLYTLNHQKYHERRTCVYKPTDRKSTRLNSSHQIISYAVFCLKKKNNQCSTRTRRSHHM